jgi:hypothetical protein
MRGRREGEARRDVNDAVNTDRNDDKLMQVLDLLPGQVGTRPRSMRR